MAEQLMPAATTLAMPRPQRSGAIRVDEHLCMTCRECEVACSLAHEGECNPALSRIHIVFDDFSPGFPEMRVCKQCDWPACHYACAAVNEEQALRIDPATGARYVEESACRGCGACVRACPLTPERPVIALKKVGRKRISFKCDLCKGRPDGPVCVQVCPGKALTYTPAAERKR